MFEIKILEINNSTNTNTGSFLQTPFWCQFKARHGWTYKRFNIEYTLKASAHNDEADLKDCNHNKAPGDLHKTFEMSVLNRSFAKGMLSIAYIPFMPQLPFECTPSEIIDKALEDNDNQMAVISQEIVTPETQTIEFAALIDELAKALKPYLPKNTIAIRFDPYVNFDNPEDRDAFNYGMKMVAFADKLKLRKTEVDIQPPDSTRVDLTATEDEILARMHQKWRYNIRLSEKKGVIIKKYSGNDVNIAEKIDKFYQLTKETNARDGNSSHAKSYYSDLIKSSAEEISAGKDVPEINL